MFFTRNSREVFPDPHAPFTPMASGVSVSLCATSRAKVAAKSSKLKSASFFIGQWRIM